MGMSTIQAVQARRDSNPQHADLESAVLPLELLAYNKHMNDKKEDAVNQDGIFYKF